MSNEFVVQMRYYYFCLSILWNVWFVCRHRMYITRFL